MRATALHQAVFLDHVEICKALLEQEDTNVNAVDEVNFLKILNIFVKNLVIKFVARLICGHY